MPLTNVLPRFWPMTAMATAFSWSGSIALTYARSAPLPGGGGAVCPVSEESLPQAPRASAHATAATDRLLRVISTGAG